MKRVLIIAPDFTPSSMPPALRVRFFAKHLPSFGWEPIVVTTDPRYYNWQIDAENEALIPEWLRVVRTPAIPAKTARRFGLGDIAMRSLWHHWRVINRFCRDERPDLLFVSVPPFMQMVLARLAHMRFRIPYVVDYIDPWVTDYYWKMPRRERPANWLFADLLSRIVEPFALRKAAHITGVSIATTDGIADRYSWLTRDDGTEIPYGGEPGDFEYLKQRPRRQSIFQKGDGLIHISYIGRGGADMNRALAAVFHGFRKGLAEIPDSFKRVRFHFVGTTYAPDPSGRFCVLPVAQQFGVQDYVTEHPGRVSYLDALQLLLDSDALLAVGSESPHYTASKIFPYIMAAKPLLAVYHEASTVLRILASTAGGTAVAFGDSKPESQFLEEVHGALRSLIASTADFVPATKWENFAEYTTEAMTARLANVFQSAVDGTLKETAGKRVSTRTASAR